MRTSALVFHDCQWSETMTAAPAEASAASAQARGMSLPGDTDTSAFYHRAAMTVRSFVPAACGAAAVLAALVAMLPALRPAGWSLTVLPRVGEGTLMAKAARERDPSFRVVPAGGYDGQFYWGIAVDPIGTGDVHQAFDTASYRYGHPLLGWLGWLLSGGQARAAPAALTFIGLASLFAGAFVASMLGRARGSVGWEGLFVAVNPGLLYSGVHVLTEPLSAALLLGGVLAYVRGRLWVAAACFGLLVLSKEQFALVPLAFAAWELLRGRDRLRDAAPFVACLVPAGLWWVYARVHFGEWFTSGDTALAAPFSGWKRAVLDAGINSYSPDGARSIMGEASLVVLAALLVLLAAAGVRALRLRGPFDPVYLLLALVVVCLAPIATTLLRDALRNTSVLLALVPFVIAGAAIRRGSGPAPPA
jgi:hypothetical protein